MKSLIAVVTILLIVPSLNEAAPGFQANMLLDTLLAAFKDTWRNKLDSFDLPSKHVRWSEYVAMLNISGTAHLHKGFVAGLATVKRSSDAFVRVLDKDRQSIVTKLNAGPLVATYQAKVAMMGIGPTVQLDVHVKNMTVDVTIILDEKTRRARIAEFELEKLEGVTAKVVTPGFLTDRVANVILKYTLRAAQPAIRYGAGVALKNMLVNAAAIVPIPGVRPEPTERTLGQG